MPNTVPTGDNYLIDSRSAPSKMPSYKRSTRLVIAQNLQILALTRDHELPNTPPAVIHSGSGVNIVPQLEPFFLKISFGGICEEIHGLFHGCPDVGRVRFRR